MKGLTDYPCGAPGLMVYWASWKGKLNKEPPIAPGRLPVREAGSQALWVKYLRLDEMATFQKSGAHLGGP